MRRPTSISKLGALALSLLLAGRLHAATLLEQINNDVTALYQNSKDSIVKVHADSQRSVGGFPLCPLQRVGTGFFIDADGRLLTAATVIDDATTCWIEYRGQHLPATVVGRDPATNLAVLKVTTNTPLPFLKLGDSATVRVGALVVTIGFPYDLPCAPAVGFVNGFDVQHGPHQFVTTHFRTDCRLSPGQGGGPLLNAAGAVVGIAVAARMDNQCYALPVNAARKIVADIIEHGAPQLGWIGLGVAEQAAVDGNDVAVVVQQIYSNTPAANIGFRDRDVLVRIGTNRVHCAADVLNATFYCRPGEHLSFTVLRENLEQNLTLVVGQRPTAQPAATPRLPQMPAFTPVSGSR